MLILELTVWCYTRVLVHLSFQAEILLHLESQKLNFKDIAVLLQTCLTVCQNKVFHNFCSKIIF